MRFAALPALATVLATAAAPAAALAQGNTCAAALRLDDVADYCSPTTAFTTEGYGSSGAAASCTPGNRAPDAWFAFTATAAGVAIKTNSLGATLDEANLTLYGGDCGALAEVACSPHRGNSALTSLVSTELTVGRTYYLRVFGSFDEDAGAWREGTFNLCVRSFVPGPPAATDCVDAERICGVPRDFTLPVFTDAGAEDDLSATCLGDAGATESQSLWYKFTAATDGLLELEFASDDPNTDIDFVVFGLPRGSEACADRFPLRCNVAGGNGCTGTTGMRAGDPDEEETPGCRQSTDPDTDPRNDDNDAFVDALRLEAGRTYLLFVNNYTVDGEIIRLSFLNTTATFTGPRASFSAEPAGGTCSSQAYTFTADDPGASYRWDFGPGADPRTATGRTVSVTFTGAPGQRRVSLTASIPDCEVFAERSVDFAPVGIRGIDLVSSEPATCTAAGSLTVAARPAGAYVYRAAGQENTTGVFEGLPAGAVEVTASAASDPTCATSASFSIGDEADLGAPVEFEAAAAELSCGSSTYDFTAAEIAGGAYAWDFGPDADPRTATGQRARATFSGASGPREVTLTVTRGSCSVSRTRPVAVDTDVDFVVDTASTTAARCGALAGGGVALIVTVDGALAPEGAFAFTLGAETNTTGVFAGLAAGPYTASVRPAGSGPECARDFGFVVPEGGGSPPPAIAVTEDPDPCRRAGFTFAVAAPTAGVAYVWDFGAGATPTRAQGAGPHAVVFSGPTGPREVAVVASRGVGCEAGAATPVAYVSDAPLEIDAATEPVTCADADAGAIDVRVAPAGDYRYRLDGGPEQAGGRFEGLAAGDYEVAVRPAGLPAACATTAVVTVGDDGSAAPFFGEVFVVEASCTEVADGGIELLGLPPGTTAALLDAGRAPARAFDGLAGGRYTLRLEGAGGCTRDTTVAVPALPGPRLDLGPDREAELGDTLALPVAVAPGRGGYDPEGIDFGGLDGSYAVREPLGGLRLAPDRVPEQVVTAVLVDEDGCTARDTVVIGVRIARVFGAPTAFSPNDDGVNDVWYPRVGPSVTAVRRVSIFDRWGGLLYTAEALPPGEPASGWDGTSGGEPMDVGTYAYAVEVTFADGRGEVLAGVMTLVR